MKVDREIDTTNKFLVAHRLDGIQVHFGGTAYILSREDALLLAAWLVSLADSMTEFEFEDVLNAVQNS